MKMNRVKRSLIYGAMTIFCLAVLIIRGRPLEVQQKGETSEAQNPTKSNLLVLIRPQEDAPLLITGITAADSTDPQIPIIRFTITNHTKLRIRAYAIRHDATLPHSSFPGTIAVNFPDRNRALQAGASSQLEISGIKYSEIPTNLILSIDFVEFESGRRWGPDTFKHGEQIDGVRAGAKMAKVAMIKTLETNGLEVLLRSLDSINVEADQPDLHSSEWLEGFRHGVGWMRERVRSKGRNLVEIKRELQHSID